MSSPTVRVDVDGLVTRITLARPEQLNRFDPATINAFHQALEQAGASGTRAVVLAAEGRVFSAGGDFGHMGASEDDGSRRLRHLDPSTHTMARMQRLTVPIVCALQGDAVGLGATIALSCDMIVAHPTARLIDSHVRVGLTAGDGGCIVWPQSCGMLRAKRHLLTGDPLDAGEAHRFGLVTDLVEAPDDVLPAAVALAERVASLPPLAVQSTKRALNKVLQDRSSEIFDLTIALELATMSSEDLVEAIAAFKEKRAGNYRGR